MARTACHLLENENFLKLLINRQNRELNLSFREKPPAHIRSHLRFIGFNWSRKKRYWHSYLNNIQVKRVRKFYKNLIKNG
ncbi:hypothetical protein GGR21_001287 [Dysgonomonas hofstadii]|uniref:Uncharacterized protein n=1 Tax=Dysgonomonas hofstadii TaxID=637886 RepID=A0A840CPC1_9BACT|nr:hypothetical protein [Dysgonomonas hofstadii]MBB4035394.1 hypothetical protein [Dysgonomonas hofstadii]